MYQHCCGCNLFPEFIPFPLIRSKERMLVWLWDTPAIPKKTGWSCRNQWSPTSTLCFHWMNAPS
jgi:hypothetical protein